ncbi:hypothetical protein DNTS_015702 [Danionella cerebrum]|uniref:Cyclin-like domain-containing protein n=1 Tax=Danionella cerebrum TaxID=2873325 RepID=A0A553QD01_9TELE|nr:hypothetical protein DNTS_015702 [Danionella translucida]
MSASLWCEEDASQRGTQASVRAPWDPSASGLRVIQRLLQSEERYLPSSLYISLVQREPQQREQLVKWTMEVCSECDCDEPVFPLAVSLLDRYLSATLSLPVSPSCLAAACVLVASKLIESDTVSADTLCAAAEYDFLSSNLREMERLVLATLRWDVAAVTPHDFIPHFLRILGELRDGDAHMGDFLTTLRRHGDTFVAMCVSDARFLGTSASLVAAAALNAALRGLRARSSGETSVLTAALATLCQCDVAVLQCCTELIEDALRERLRDAAAGEKDSELEDERASTPTDLREIDF